MNGVVWLVLSTSGLLVALNLGIGGLALSSYRTGSRTADRLIASGELDEYHAAWLLGPGFRRSDPWQRECAAAEMAVRSLITAGLVRLDLDGRTSPEIQLDPAVWLDPDQPLLPSAELDQEVAVVPEHPLALEAWRFARDSWSAGRPVTVKALTAHPAFKTACRAHSEQVSGYLPLHRTRRDNRADRAPWAAGLIAAGWITVNTCVLLARKVSGERGIGAEGGYEKFDKVLAATLGTAALSGFLLVTFHVLVWRAWQDRWPQRLRTHCQAMVRQGPETRSPLSRPPH
ncbi:hypothetical protein OG413_38735 [Streptomyces sp. NBC_01433]|uniref:hypothetical protein n=1 Tax=Streptomyces sp. NBC_01433 TaxID=2903864 RepID=UPI0022534B83|nr:hypothetical protein [Streptomyces sp. NBC_01433]MCX4681144.1 hypothetical protein [Streptomyces sp. NBC_01433]